MSMKAAIFKGPGVVEIGERPDPVIQEPTDAVVRVVLGCVCGSDLWYYRGESPHAVGSIGHEFIGIVEQAGAEVRGVREATLVVAPFIYSDMSCPHCLNGSTISCPVGGTSVTARSTAARGRRSAFRWPAAPSCPSRIRTSGCGAAVAARAVRCDVDWASRGGVAGVKKGDTVTVVGDGAVGLCAVLASRRLGAERIIALSRHADRQEVAREFGATDIVEARGEEAIQAVLDLTSGVGADAALECVGTAQSIATAFAVARPGSTVGIVGVPHGQLPFAETFFRNTGWRGGPAPARIYIPELLGDVLDGVIDPGRVFDYETDLDHIADAYQTMDERRAIKSLVRVGAL